MKIKDDLRYLIGLLLRSLGLKEPSRYLYILLAKKYVNKLNHKVIEAVWVRRSIVTDDFIPISSDIDLTILINEKNLHDLSFGKQLRPSQLVQDIQLISTRFFHAWLETGGFRNRQINNWKQIAGSSINLKTPSIQSRQEIAFELGYELHLLYRQFINKSVIMDSLVLQQNYAFTKILLETERIRLYWDNLDKDLLYRERTKIQLPGSFQNQLILIDQFCEELLRHVAPQLNKHDWTSSIQTTTDSGWELYLQIDEKQVFVTKNINETPRILKEKPHYFVTTSNYLNLIKGIGIQEQTLLNNLARTNSYYRKFNCQRLAHDLIGALVLAPMDIKQLYYCFSNIHYFLIEMTQIGVSNWNEIEKSWRDLHTIPFNSVQLREFSITLIDQLENVLYDKINET